MSLVFKPFPTDARSNDSRFGPDSDFDTSPPSASAPSRFGSPAPLDVSHLVPCPHCGALNGRVVAACWSCESDLVSVTPLRRANAPTLRDEAPAAEPPSPWPSPGNTLRYGSPLNSWGEESAPDAAQDELAAFASTPEARSRGAAHSGFGLSTEAHGEHHPPTVQLMATVMRPRRKRMLFIGIAGLAVVGVLVALYFGLPSSDNPYQALSPGRAPPANTAPVAPPSSTPPEAAMAESLPTQGILSQAGSRALVEVQAPPMPTMAATLAKHHGDAAPKRRAPRSAAPAAATAVPQPGTPRGAAPARPCTATVEALGLCSAPRSAATKE